MHNSIPSLSILMLFLILLSPQKVLKSQESSYHPPQKRVFVGGGLGLQFGNETLIDLSPHVGYMLTDNLAIAAGITYKYYKYYDFKTDIYGGRVFSRYYFLENFFAHAEYKVLSFDAALFDPYGLFLEAKRRSVSSLFVGGGYRQQIGGNTYIYIMGLFNLIEDQYSPYDNPVIRIGIDAGL